jgi:hypothetical protein
MNERSECAGDVWRLEIQVTGSELRHDIFCIFSSSVILGVGGGGGAIFFKGFRWPSVASETGWPQRTRGKSTVFY